MYRSRKWVWKFNSMNSSGTCRQLKARRRPFQPELYSLVDVDVDVDVDCIDLTY
jgi:hypothetical protein